MGAALQPPDLITVSYDSANQVYVGLHLDNWDRDTIERRHLSRHRMSVNVGSEDRFLLFINLTLTAMRELLIESGLDTRTAHYRPTALGGAFMRAFPSYPVTRLKIAPGEAYIAPTENMIHDGSTFGMSGSDIALHILGHFALATTAGL